MDTTTPTSTAMPATPSLPTSSPTPAGSPTPAPSGFVEVSAESAYDHFVEISPSGPQVTWPSLDGDASAIVALTADDWAAIAAAARADDRVHQAIHDALWDALTDRIAIR